MTRTLLIDPRRPPTPTRLMRSKSRWQLEVVRWITSDNRVWTPEPAIVDGAAKILECLREHGDHGLASAAHALMEMPDQGRNLTFDIADGRWRPQANSSPPPPATQSEVSGLRREMTVLRALHDSLRDRVAALEAASREVVMRLSSPPPRRENFRRTNAGGSPPAYSAKATGAHATGSRRMSGDGSGNSAAEAQPSVAPIGTAAPKSAAPKSAAPIAEPPDALAPPAAPKPDVLLPSLQEVNSCLSQLLGSDVKLVAAAPPVPDFAPGARFGNALIDDADEVVGMIVADARGAAELGGALLGLPESAIDEQASGSLTEDTSGALAEICNNIAGVMNRNGSECHVRTIPLEAKHSIVASKRLDLSTSGGGRFSVLAR